ncbi:hypothetical protein LT330_010683 [Penicillium expansum]|nr:hypothetical protein LT330_010683 [Penicillium expansum]
MSFLWAWLLTWDDQLDETSESLGGDFDAGQAFREQTLSFVKKTLGLKSDKDHTPFIGTGYDFIQKFSIIGNFIKQAYNEEQKEALMDEIELIIHASKVEQQLHLQQRLPTIEDYWDYRLGTNLMGVILAATELSLQTQIPRPIMQHTLMKDLWQQTNTIISLTNDILSLKKEINNGEVISLVPLLYVSVGDLQKAVDIAIEKLKTAVEKFMGIRRNMETQFEIFLHPDMVS